MKSQKGTWKLVGEKIFGKILSLRQVFSNLVSPPQAKKIPGKIPSLSRVFGFPDENKKTVTETSFDWNLIFPRKTKKKKNNKTVYHFRQCSAFNKKFLKNSLSF